jgi:outer membrane protein assembly factor BamB
MCNAHRILTFVMVLRCCCAAAWADDAAPKAPGLLPRIPREVQQRLAQARQAIEQQRYSDAAAELQVVLGAETDDGFVAGAEGEATQRTARREAWRLLDSMPPAGRQSYETQFGPQARAMLQEAIGRSDRAALARISDTYFHTAAGRQATMLLAGDRLDRSRPLEAIGWLRRIGQSPPAAEACEPDCSLMLAACWVLAGNADQARDVLDSLHRRYPAARFRIGNREFTASDQSDETLRWLVKLCNGQRAAQRVAGDQWPLFRGDTARNAQSAFDGKIGELLWAVRTVEGSADKALLRTARKTALGEGVPLLPAAHPLVVGDTVLVRKPWQLVAVEGKSGRQVWEFPWKKPANDRGQLPSGSALVETDRAAVIQQRVFEDAAYGQLSSDGCRVFLLDKLGSRTASSLVVGQIVVAARAAEPLRPNRLVALDLKREGAVAWVVGGPSGEDEPKLAYAFFLGAPLPDRQWVYVLAEIKGEILLCALHGTTGRLEWSRAIACPGDAISQEPVRRLVGASPSLADGVLVCPTSAGAVVAIDAATRSLLWGYQYPRAERFKQPVALQPINLGNWSPAKHQRESEVRDCWIDSCTIVANGRVVLAPVDSDLLYCLDAFTGEELWSCRRGENLFVACLHEDKIVLVGNNEVMALRLADRKPAWKTPISLPSGAMPSGRGLYCGSRYCLPTTARQLVRIDLDEGRIESVAETKEILGNLVGLPDRLISQTAESVQQFGAEQ